MFLMWHKQESWAIMNESDRGGVCISNDSSSSIGGDDDCESSDEGSHLAHTLVVCFIYGPIVVVTILGNFIVITAFVREPAIRCRVSNYFIFSLSVADFLVGLIMGFNFVWLLTDDWVLGMVPCLLWLSLDYAMSFASVLSIISISLDRYRLVTLKLRYAVVQTRRRATLTICSCWAFCLVFFPAVVVLWSPVTGENIIDYSFECDLQSRENLYLNLFLIAIEFIIPLIVLVYLNTRLYLLVRKRAKGLVFTFGDPVPTVSSGVAAPSFKTARGDRASGLLYITEAIPGRVSLTSLTLLIRDDSGTNTGAETAHTAVASTACSSPEPSNEPTSHQSPLANSYAQSTRRATFHRYREFQKHRKAAVTLSLLVGAYILCWLPFYIKNTILAFCGDCINYYVQEVTDNLLWCNSTINPILYALLNMKYRRYFARVFRQLCCMCNK
ncbi:muscarinic acetylcholine receptor M3-like [Acanthaster planci]|uniref:Muscarinic acetylcholine receptor M3-like n=1 Tax=Acanthaster planci TaxID=133434 RepID=A0A8B7YIT2_ACAPL|nr:muscarinic acetylcholine receptor M3-like [Acanthaster planci]